MKFIIDLIVVNYDSKGKERKGLALDKQYDRLNWEEKFRGEFFGIRRASIYISKELASSDELRPYFKKDNRVYLYVDLIHMWDGDFTEQSNSMMLSKHNVTELRIKELIPLGTISMKDST